MKKKLTTLALIIVATTFIQAQSNLVFNQVLIVELALGEEQIVPEGKVWKIESVDGTTGIIKVNGSSWNVSLGNGDSKNMPAWFPAGTILEKSNSVSTSNYISVLEFNVVAISSSGSGVSGGGVSADGLIFSQVINISFPGSEFTNPLPNSTSTYRIAGQITVPDGKVWKINDVQTYIESVGGNPNTSTLSCNVRLGEYFFNTPTETRKGVYLKSGIHIVTFNNSPGISSSGGYVNKVTINAIEYNE